MPVKCSPFEVSKESLIECSYELSQIKQAFNEKPNQKKNWQRDLADEL
jgi:hypothetical protein